jgi:diadenosine tetraphosphate (Ap4A) HIT family hydrolase
MPIATCIFCNLENDILVENDSSLAFFDNYPISNGHSLVIPKRHVETLWELTDREYSDCFLAARSVKEILSNQHSPDGFNIGVNCGEAAGQSIWHAHIHVIPRYKGDVPNPKGGIRHIIPLKGFY